MDKILIVDDDADMQLVLSGILKQEGYEVIVAGDGMQALEKAGTCMPEMVLLDVMLPGMNGIDVLEEIKKINKDCLVMMLTGYGDIKDAVRAMKSGAFDYISKPIDDNDLVYHVREALQSYHQCKSKNLPPISAREKQVLKWLRKGKSSWDISQILEISERTVNFHINNIMKKFDAITRTQALAIAVENGLIEAD